MSALLFSYGVRFWLALTLASCMFLFTQKKRRYFAITFPVCLLFTACAFYLIYQRPDTFRTSVSNFILCVGLMTLLGMICFDVSLNDCSFCTLAAYGVQHIASLAIGCLPESASALLFPDTLPGAALKLTFRLAIYAIFFALFGKRLKDGDRVSLGKGHLLLVFALGIILEIVLYDIIRRSYAGHPRDLVYLAQNLTSMLCSFVLLLLQFTLLLQHSLENELQVLAQMRQMEQQQYQLSRATIDQINLKCHDMRHQIRRIGNETQIAPETVADMEKVINIYDSMPKTGCSALDIILAEKNMYCQQNGILISCIADGKKLSFMSDADIYSLFGNILDNAIRAVVTLPPDQREIGLSIQGEGGLLSIHSHNYYGGDLILENGLPKTTQEDTSVHGFGVQSMRQVVKKYGGDISFHTAHSVFSLNILFPQAA